MLIAIIVITIFLIVSITLNFIAYKLINILIQKNETYEKWIGDVQEDINEVYLEMKNIDDREIFQRDDEVGIVFTDLHNILKEFNERIK